MGKYIRNHLDEFPSPPTRISDEYKETESDRILNMISNSTWWTYAGFPSGVVSENQQVTTWQTINYIPSYDPLDEFINTYVKQMKLPTEGEIKEIEVNPTGGSYDFEEAKRMLDDLQKQNFTPGGDITETILKDYYDFYAYVIGVPSESLPPPNADSFKYKGNKNLVTSLGLNPEIEDGADMLVYLYLQPENTRKNNLDSLYSELQEANLEEFQNINRNADNLNAVEALQATVADALARQVDTGADLTDEQRALLEDLNDEEKLQERILQSTNCLLKLNLGQYIKASYQDQNVEDPSRDFKIDRYEKQIYKSYGNCTDFINKLTYNPKSKKFIESKPNEISSLVPMIRIYKTYHNKKNSKITKEVEFNFDGGTTESILNPKGRVGLKSFDWKLNATDPATIRNDIEATLVLYFQRFDDLLNVRMGRDVISGELVKYKYEDLLLRPPVNASPQNIESSSDNGADCQREGLIYDPSFYEIKAVIGWAPPNTSGFFSESAKSQQLPLFLTLIDHEFNFTQEGTFELSITYRARMESLMNDPRMDVFSTEKMKERIDALNKRVSGLTKNCGSDKLIESYQDQIEIIREEGRDSFAETILEGLQDRIYITKVGRSDLMSAIVDASFGEDTEDFKRRTGISKNKKGEIVQGTTGVFNNDFGVIMQREASLSTSDLQLTTKNVKDIINGKNSAFRDEIQKQLQARLKDSFSSSHPVSKKKQEGSSFTSLTAQSLPSTYDEAGVAVINPIVGAAYTEAKRSGFQGLKQKANDLLDASFGLVGIETESALNKRGVYRKEKPAEGKRWEIKKTDIENIGFIQNADSLYMPWFYFGDLINLVIKHCFNKIIPQSEENNYVKKLFENLNVIMGPFNLYGVSRGGEEVVNGSIADVPVSVELFNRWFVNNVVESNRNSYPLLEFMRDVAKDLLLPVINRQCFNTLRFRRSWTEQGAIWWDTREAKLKTATVSLPSKNNSDKGEAIALTSAGANNAGENPFNQYLAFPDSKFNSSTQVYLDAWLADTSNILTKRENSREQTMNNSYHVFALYLVQPDNFRELGPPNDGEGTREERDLKKNGIHHLFLAADRGIVKQAKFSKVNAPYLREARIQQDALNPLAQLAATYNCDLTLVGNTIFWPGQYIYINPVGYGSGLGQPDIIGTPSNQLGLGGYHIVTKVECFIEDGKFETQVRGLFHFSGDGCPSLPEAQDTNNCSKGPTGTQTKEISSPTLSQISNQLNIGKK